MEKTQSVDHYIEKHPERQAELTLLRQLVTSTELQETVKWGAPVYTLKNKNVIGLGAFKSYVGIWFYNGAFLQDNAGVLINAQEGKTRGMRQWRFNHIDEINPELVLDYVQQAIENQKQGKAIAPQKKPLMIPEQLAEALNQHGDLNQQFGALTPGKQKEYAAYIDEAKREDTKAKRLAKIIPMILEGKGLNDKYR